MPALFQPFKLRSLTLPNRTVVAPMCQYSAVDGLPSHWHSVHLGGMMIGGAGLIILEATGVTEHGRISAGCLGLWNDAQESALRGLLAELRDLGNWPLGIQLNHAGRKAGSARPWEGGRQRPDAGGAWPIMAPSAIGHYPDDIPPRAMTEADMDEVKTAFASAAARAVRAGCEAIEIHAAHGYLLHQFLSPVSNHRTDRYGGKLENRMRFPLEVFEVVRAAVPPSIPVGLRLSATDWLEESGQESWTLDQSVVFANALKERGCDFIHVSTGGLAHDQKIKAGPLYQLPHARAIKHATDLPTMAVGMITTPQQAEDIILRGDADLVAMARAYMMNPRWLWSAAAELGAKVDAPPQTWRASGTPIFNTRR